MQNLCTKSTYNLTNCWSKFARFDFLTVKIRLTFLERSMVSCCVAPLNTVYPPSCSNKCMPHVKLKFQEAEKD